jgi:pheromone shutdown protein TraB
MQVRFCVVPSPRADEIADLAREFAALDPNARRVVVAGDDDYPEEQIAAAIANVANPGAVVLTGAGDVHAVLDVEEALNGGIVDLSFAKARIA